MTNGELRKLMSSKVENELTERIEILAEKYAALETRLHIVETKQGLSIWQKIRTWLEK